MGNRGLGKNDAQSSTVQLVLDVLNVWTEPRTVRELVSEIRSRQPSLSESQVVGAVKALEGKGIRLRREGYPAKEVRISITITPPIFESLTDYYFSVAWNASFWTVLGMSVTFTALYLSPLSYPWTLLRVPPVLPLFIYFPGRNFLRIFLREEPSQFLELVLFRIGSSILLVLLLGLLLDFSPLRLSSLGIALSLVGLNILLALSASLGDYRGIHHGQRVSVTKQFSVA